MSRNGDISHATLVAAGKRWLLAHGCRVVATELTAGGSLEIPDVIGWSNTKGSCIVECKVSRSDFLRDRAKPGRAEDRAEYGLGSFRYYLAPSGLLSEEAIPEGWGLLEYTPSRHATGYFVRVKREAKHQQRADFIRRRETEMLLSVAWRALKALQLVGRLGYCDEDEGPSAEVAP